MPRSQDILKQLVFVYMKENEWVGDGNDEWEVLCALLATNIRDAVKDGRYTQEDALDDTLTAIKYRLEGN